MIIQHNMSASTASGNLGITKGNLAKTSRNLATGYKINFAADNTSGLGMSEKMRNQIRGLNQASDNMESAIAAIQTADGGMAEIQSILQRVSELCVKGANDTNQDVDRQAIQEEIDALLDEVDNITNHTKYNGIQVLMGRDPVVTPIYGVKGNLPSIVLGAADGGTANSTALGSLSDTTSLMGDYYSSTIAGFTNTSGGTTTTATTITLPNGTTYSAGDVYMTDRTSPLLGNGQTSGTISQTFTDASGTVWNVNINETHTKKAGNHATAYLDFSQIDSTNINSLLNMGFHTTCCTCTDRYSIKFVDTGDAISQQGNNYIYEIDITSVASGTDLVNKIISAMSTGSNQETFESAAGSNFSAVKPQNHYTAYTVDPANKGRLYVFDERPGQTASGQRGLFGNGVYQQVKSTTVGMKYMNIQTGANGFDGVKVYLPNTELSNLGLDGTVDVSSWQKASDSIALVQDALGQISEYRGYLGAMSNRFASAVISTDNNSENTQSAESLIRDADMADEMVEYSKNNILLQAGHSMLTQANSQLQGVVNLLSQ